jgi:hypothetical protein
LITAARELFHAQEYHDTGTKEIVARAAVGTRGALSAASQTRRTGSRFSSKLSSATFGSSLGPGTGVRPRVARPRVQRVILIDGPAVLGWDESREIEAQYGLGAIEVALKTAMGAGPFGVSTAA